MSKRRTSLHNDLRKSLHDLDANFVVHVLETLPDTAAVGCRALPVWWRAPMTAGQACVRISTLRCFSIKAG